MKTILVVDDEFSNVEALRLILQGQGYQVLTAWNGEDALAMVKDDPVDLIITDLMMPIMGGLALCHKLHEQAAQSVPQVILMSAEAQPAADDKCHYAYFLNKPFGLAQLNEAVQGCIGKPDGA